MYADFLPVCQLGDEHVVDGFDCGVLELDRWLRRMAKAAGTIGTGTTFVLASAEPVADEPVADEPVFDGPAADGPAGLAVLGYYTLAVRAVEQDLRSRVVTDVLASSVSVIQLVRLAVHCDAQGVGLGGELLVEALGRAVRAADAIGARAVVVEATDEPAYRFYEHFGFEPLDGMRLFQRIDVLRAALDPAA